MAKPTEKDLDRALEEAFKTNPVFTEWFLGRTKFRGLGASYLWSRSNHPWGEFEFSVLNPHTGNQETVIKEGETDVLVVLEDHAKRRVAIHIENKLASGHFTSFQPELYAARAACWKGNPKYCGYEDWETVLVAPSGFYDRWTTEASKFDRFVPHEEIALHVPLFAVKV